MSEEHDRLHSLIYESLRIVEDSELAMANLAKAIRHARELREELAALIEEGAL